MASGGGVPESGGARSSGRGGRREIPRSVSIALVFVHALFAATVVGGAGLLLTAGSYDALDGGVLARTVYAAAPGVLGWWLARRSRAGGDRVRRGLVAVQAWLILGGLANLAAGSARGGLQLLLPVLIVCFLLQGESREWYRLPPPERAGRRPFSLARMIRRRRGDEGQTAVEYAGLVAIVAAVVLALVVSGLGTQIYGDIQAQVCKVTGLGCPAPASHGAGTDASGPTNGGGTGDEPADGGAGAPATDAGRGDGGRKDDGDNGTAGSGRKEDRGCFSGAGAFFGCAGNQVKQVGQGLFVDGVWGDLTGIYGMARHPIDTVKGIGDYGEQLGRTWWDDSKDARDKWSGG